MGLAGEVRGGGGGYTIHTSGGGYKTKYTEEGGGDRNFTQYRQTYLLEIYVIYSILFYFICLCLLHTQTSTKSIPRVCFSKR